MFGLKYKKKCEDLEQKLADKEFESGLAAKLIETQANDIKDLANKLSAERKKNKELSIECEHLKKENTSISDNNNNLNISNSRLEKELEKSKKETELVKEVKRQLRDLCFFRDKNGNVVKNSRGLWISEHVDGLKIWDLTNLL